MSHGKECKCKNPEACECGDPRQLSGSFAKVLKAFGLQVNKDISDGDKVTALYAALTEESDNEYAYIVAVFEQDFVYTCYKEGGWTTYRRKYSIDDGGTITMSKDVEKVRPETDFVPVDVRIEQGSEQPTGETTMSEKETPQQMEARLKAEAEAKVRAEAEAKAQAEADARVKAETEAKAKAEAEARAKALSSLENYIEAAPEAFRGELQQMAAHHKAHKEQFVEVLSAKGGLSKEELQGMSMSVLEKMAKTLGEESNVTFIGQGAGNLKSNKADEQYTPPMEAFPVQKTA